MRIPERTRIRGECAAGHEPDAFGLLALLAEQRSVERHAIELGHHQITEHQVEAVLPQRIESRWTAERNPDVMLREQARQRAPHHRVVVDDEHPELVLMLRARLARGYCTNRIDTRKYHGIARKRQLFSLRSRCALAFEALTDTAADGGRPKLEFDFETATVGPVNV